MSTRWRRLAFACLMSMGAFSAGAVTNEEVRLAGEGRFDEVAQRINARAASGALTTADWHALCYAQSRVKRYRALFDCLDRLTEASKGRDRSTRLFGLDDVTPAINVMRGEALIELGQYADADAQAKLALEWLTRERSDDHDVRIGALSVLGLSRALQGNLSDARKVLEQLRLVPTRPLAGDPFASQKTLSIAKLSLALGQYREAFETITADRGFELRSAIERMLHGARKEAWMWQELPRLYMIHKAQFGMGRTAEAKAGFDALLVTNQIDQNSAIHWLTLFDRGQIAEQEGRIDEALEFYRRAIEVIERLRSSINTETNKIGFVGDKQEVYGRRIGLLFRQKRFDEGFEFIDRAKSRALVDLLASRQQFGPSQFARRGQVRSDVARLVDHHTQAEAGVLEQLTAADPALQRAAHASALADLRRAAPDLASMLAPTAAPAQEVRDLVASDETVIQYYLRGDTLYVGVLGKMSTGFTLDGRGIAEEVRALRTAVGSPRRDATTPAATLYRRLIEPLEAALPGRRLLIVPHGVLHYVPFGALWDGKRHLLERYSLRVLPSATVARYVRKATGGPPARVLAFGNPDLGVKELDLPGSERETRTLVERIPGSVLRIRGEATKQAFRQLAGEHKFIHVAAHGEFDSDLPLGSRLYLAKSAEDDGQLTVSDLYNLELEADLVTLSACDTGLGKVLNGDDVVGLMRGFLYAGASSVVGSLWKVDDAATSNLMLRFYENLKQSAKSEALQEAQLAIRKTRAHPFYWAAFYLTGAD